MTDPIATVREAQERIRLIANTLSAADLNGLEGICGRAADALDAVVAEIERLRLHLTAGNANCERLSMQLAACAAVARANTEETAYRARAMHQDYRCDAVVAVAEAVDREMAHRAEIEALRREKSRAASLSDQVRHDYEQIAKLLAERDALREALAQTMKVGAAIDAARAKEAGDA